jgi:NADPH:quinone reductase-like Zn-dependent oxidoreductase
MGREYVGIVEEVGAQVQTVRPGRFVWAQGAPAAMSGRLHMTVDDDAVA